MTDVAPDPYPEPSPPRDWVQLFIDWLASQYGVAASAYPDPDYPSTRQVVEISSDELPKLERLIA